MSMRYTVWVLHDVAKHIHSTVSRYVFTARCMPIYSASAYSPVYARAVCRCTVYGLRGPVWRCPSVCPSVRDTPVYTVSQKTSHLRLAITLTYVNGFWYFSAEMLPVEILPPLWIWDDREWPWSVPWLGYNSRDSGSRVTSGRCYGRPME